MLRKMLAMAFLCLAVMGSSAFAQSGIVVLPSGCGTGNLSSGGPGYDTVDTTGRHCTTSGGGNTGGYEFAVAVTPTVQNASYSAGNALGGKQTISVFRTAGGAAKLNNISLWSKSGQTVNVTFYIFTSDPTSSTCTDKSAFSLNAADVAKLIATTPPVLTPHVVGSGTTATSDAWQVPVSMSNGDATTNIYVCAVVGGTVTPSTTSDYVMKFSGPQD